MIWFRKRQEPDVPVIPFGSLRVVKAWSGHYVIEQYGPRFTGRTLCLCWRLVEDAGRFDTPQAAIERIRFMGKFDMLMTGPVT